MKLARAALILGALICAGQPIAFVREVGWKRIETHGDGSLATSVAFGFLLATVAAGGFLWLALSRRGLAFVGARRATWYAVVALAAVAMILVRVYFLSFSDYPFEEP